MGVKRKRPIQEASIQEPSRRSTRRGVALKVVNSNAPAGIEATKFTPVSLDLGPRYFLMKAEPESRIEKGKDVKFSIDDLRKVDVEPWDGVRNAEASKTMRERMKKDDYAFFYHSNTKEPGIAGIASIHKEGYADSSAWDPDHRNINQAILLLSTNAPAYYDSKSDQAKPKWYRVDVKYVRHMTRFITLRELKESQLPALQNMQLLKRPQLSVQRVSPAEWDCILELEKMPSAVSNAKKASGRKKIAKSADGEQHDTELTTKNDSSASHDMDQEVMAAIRDSHGGDA
ncbi:protein of unknown function [Taphrina deformans PYCC 5710]|uniref:EVE domain-containing protein n=1 Tax=Taphrina deformans (strain PYCC 5710 / ATCC 11124 / CBS 356.35 / IMI 108563 / JCM 9778 / NBRC 8474) TaxID=1097556 RepID=R4XDP6_TAPDE|nr:protein of unknown function [Taphrina deformans PYCC 5710]|eukprot:CCG83955.1 protein of unknown function [Taphrina deformans PYCC 5710]